MDKNLQAVMTEKINRTVQALSINDMDANYVKGLDELFERLNEMMFEGATCSVGGSMTLFETGVIDYLKNGPYEYFDRYDAEKDREEVFRKARNCDFFFCSSNAITEDGLLYNVDGRGNRVSNLIDGPEKVIVIAGSNKIVKNLDAAICRVQDIAAPANAKRLNVTDYRSIWSHAVISGHQSKKNRITVFILPEPYGY